ncbi:hypothetical protein [Kutzneria buriramensis]|uniref:Uncharacterized protein n=1 Tax=Kutzneria buriramensis TaxID=1045776 RepID=A0A3E0HQH7_9PSEU|nr:hypothetical protein [Kutzneria buriramensis]REH48641.1 hypothetical protein BCF44_105500 [Kutzneria buriramensis]
MYARSVMADACVRVAPVAVPRARRAPARPLGRTLAELDHLHVADRLDFLREVQSDFAGRLDIEPGRWRNIEGVLEFFRDNELARPGSWMSIVDASILEGLQRGTAIALGLSEDTHGNPGSAEWASYLRRLSDGELDRRSVHDAAWSRAEQAATEHGVALARTLGVAPSAAEWRFYQFSQVYRWVMRNEPTALLALGGPLMNPAIRELRMPFLSWFTDVGTPVPAYRGCAFAWALSRLNPVGGAFSGLGLLVAYLPNLFEDFLIDTGRR